MCSAFRDGIPANLLKNNPGARVSYGVWSGPAGPARVKERVPYYEATAVNSQSGKAEKIMDILEFLMSAEGEALTTTGIENVHYTLNGTAKAVKTDAVNIEYLLRPYKHPLRGWVNDTAVFDEFVNTQPWAGGVKDAFDNICAAGVGVCDPTDGYFARIPKRTLGQIGNKPELTVQKWEAYFMTGKNNQGGNVAADQANFNVCWDDLKVNKMDTLANELTKILLK